MGKLAPMKLSKYLSVMKLSQTEFAKAVDRRDSQISRWLKGERRPDWDSMLRIAEATDGAVMPNDFLDEAPSKC